MKQHCEKQNKNIFDYLPLTFKLDCFSEATQQDQLMEIIRVVELIQQNIQKSTDEINEIFKALKKPYKINYAEHDHQNMWLLKPTGFNRGIGIHLFKSVSEL